MRSGGRLEWQRSVTVVCERENVGKALDVVWNVGEVVYNVGERAGRRGTSRGSSGTSNL
jgi:hypothetical protein